MSTDTGVLLRLILPGKFTLTKDDNGDKRTRLTAGATVQFCFDINLPWRSLNLQKNGGQMKERERE